MVNAIGSERSYMYETSTGSGTASLALEEMFKRQRNTTTDETSTANTVTQMTAYSTEEHLEMMKSRKLPAELEEIIAKMAEEATEETTELAENEDVSLVTESISSFATQAQGNISTIDADGDGTISTDEYEVMIEQMGIANAMTADEFFTEYDTNEDGEISVDEMPKPGRVGSSMENADMAPPLPGAELDDTTISAYDTDGDGVLSAEEFSAMMEAIRPDEEEKDEQSDETTDSQTMNLAQMAFQNRIFQAMSAYETQYKSMFESEEGSLLSNQA